MPTEPQAADTQPELERQERTGRHTDEVVRQQIHYRADLLQPAASQDACGYPSQAVNHLF